MKTYFSSSFLQGLFVALIWLYGATPSHAAALQPGFKTMGIYDASFNIRLDINVWYPTYSRPSFTNYAPWRLHVVPYGRQAAGRFPLLILSHDSTATRFSYHNTAAMLAKSGFVVIAPNHKNDNINVMPHLFSVQQLTQRIAELRATLDIALTHADIHTGIDPQRIGIVGFGVGGTAALLLGGAEPQGSGWYNYCEQTKQPSVYCTPWAKRRMEKMATQLPFNQSYVDTRITAVAAVTPSYGMFFSPEALRNFTPPLLLVEAQKDTRNIPPLTTAELRKNFPQVPYFTSIEHVDSTDLMSPCPEALRKDMPELCDSVEPEIRIAAHKQLNTALRTFFLETLGSLKSNAPSPVTP